MAVPTYNNTIRFDDWPKPGQPFSSRFISNYSDKVRQDFNFMNGGLSLADNMNGAIVTMSMTHGVPVLVSSPLRNNARPIGALVLSCDKQTIPNLTITTSAVVNGVTVVAPAGSVWVTALYGVNESTVTTISRDSSTKLTTGSSAAVVNVCTTTSMTLTSGDWSLSGAVGFSSIPGTVTAMNAAVSKVSATFPSGTVIGDPVGGEFWSNLSLPSFPANNEPVISIPTYRVVVSFGNTLQLFLVASASYTGTGANAVFVAGFLQARLMGVPSNTNATVRIYFAGA